MVFINLLFTSLLTICAAQDIFYFTKHPEPTTVVAGQSATLQCEVSHSEQIVTYWSFNDTRVTDTPRKQQSNRNLHITRADPVLDVGDYACIAENSTTGFSLTSRTAPLTVAWISNAVVQKVSPEIKSGADLILRCSVEGSEINRYEWYRNEQLLTKSERVQMKFGKGQLTLRELSPADNGVYNCAGGNAAGLVRSQQPVVVRLRDQHTPNITILPMSHAVKRGDTTHFDCQFQAADEIVWYFNGARIQSNSRRTINKNGTIVISKVRPADEGAYICTGISKRADNVEDVESYSANLTVAFLEELSVSSLEPKMADQFIISPLNSQFEMSCLPPRGVPQPSVFWLNPMNQTIAGGLLFFESIKLSDGGNYTCVAENMAGVRRLSVSIIVSEAPRTTRDMRTVSMSEGDRLSLPCIYQGSHPPATTFQWKKDGRYVGPSAYVSSMNGTLFLPSLQPNDRGSYVCEVTTFGFSSEVTAPTLVHIREILKFAPRPVSRNLEKGSLARIHCKAQGSPTPNVRWVKDSKDHPPALPSHLTDINGTLLFKNASMTDRGRYTCVASNLQGTINATIDIDVSVPPWFTVAPKNYTEAQEGLPAVMHCVAEGVPSPTVSWDKDGDVNAIDRARFHTLENGTLYVTAVHRSDKGRYGCIAGNSFGFKRLETELVIRGADELEDGQEEESMMTRTVVITLSAAAGYMSLVIGLMVWCRYRRRKRKQAFLNENPEGILLAKAENGDLKGERNDGEGKKLKPDERQGDGAETAHSQSSGQSRRSGRTLNYEKLSYQRQNLRDLKLLGSGIFGQVLIGRADPLKHLVAVKSLQNTRDEVALAEFKREIDMFHKLSHTNVVRLVGLCRESEPHYLILEYTDWGDLKQFLQSTRKERSKLSTGQLLDLAKQVSVGMEYISNARHVHRDLGARNCLVTSDMQVKVTILALSKDVHSSDYAHFRNQVIPLRWLPAESVFEDDYSTKSDVYSFGVLCWELFHQGDRPFSNLSDELVTERLERRELIVKPSKHLPSRAASLLAACTSNSPKDRPTFSSIAIAMTEVLAEI